jgi:hypothetical protein
MFVAQIPVSDYLQRVLRASQASAYAGVLLIIARRADRGRLLDQVIDGWESLHSVTRRHLAIVCPTEHRMEGTFVHGRRGNVAVGLANDEIRATVPEGDYRWKRAFFGDGPFDPLLSGVYRSPWPPNSARDAVNAMTAAANDMGAYFGLAEASIPCVVVVSLWERRAVVLPAAPDFDLYQFTKAVTESFETQAATVDIARSELAEAAKALEEAKTAASRGVIQARGRIDRLHETWQKQLARIKRKTDLAAQADPHLAVLLDTHQSTLDVPNLAQASSATRLHDLASQLESLQRRDDAANPLLAALTNQVEHSLFVLGELQERMSQARDQYDAAIDSAARRQDREARVGALEGQLHNRKQGTSLSACVREVGRGHNLRRLHEHRIGPVGELEVEIIGPPGREPRRQ